MTEILTNNHRNQIHKKELCPNPRPCSLDQNANIKRGKYLNLIKKLGKISKRPHRAKRA